MTTSEIPTAETATGQLLAFQIGSLEQLVQQANVPGNLEGLLARHILGERQLRFSWNVNPLTAQWITENEHRLTHAHGLAALGYGLAGLPSPLTAAAQQHLLSGLPKLMRRSPFQTDGVTFINDPAQVVGLALASNAIHEGSPQARTWLASVLEDPRLKPATLLLGLFHEYARHLLSAAPTFTPEAASVDDPVVLAGLHWLAVAGRKGIVNGADDLRRLQSKVLSAIALGQPSSVSAIRAALLLEAAARVVTANIDGLIQSPSYIATILSQFPDVMHQWRYDGDDLDNPIRWPITEEREIQNIVWIMLRPIFHDLVAEEPLRKKGHSTYRADFGIPSLGLLIEVKYARKASDFKKFQREISEDYLAYLSGNDPYRKLAIFIYDESSSVQEHGITRAALLKLPHITDVVIVSRPSHVPVTVGKTRKKAVADQPPGPM